MTRPSASNDPFARFRAAYDEAAATGIENPNAMLLTTATRDGRPSARVVLLKGFDALGFVFYTNLDSRKAREIAENPHVALDFFWRETSRQIVVEGVASLVDPAEADAYFRTRPRRSQLGAWASRQSEPLPGQGTLLRAYVREKWRFSGGEVPRPEHWSGFRVRPERFEFWYQGAFRLHERVEFLRDGDGWSRRLLYP